MCNSDLGLIASEENVTRAATHVGRRFRSLKAPEVLAAQVALARKRLTAKSFKLRSTRLKRLEKSRGRTRPIHRFDISDRIVFRAVHEVIWPMLEPQIVASIAFCTFRSAGFYPPRGVAAAHLQIAQARRSGSPFIVKSDIEGFFNRIVRDKLSKILKELLDGSDCTELAIALLSVPIPVDEDLTELERILLSDGIPQGAATSPLFACLYLRQLDLWLHNQGLHALRYVDDIIICCGTEPEGRKVLASLRAEAAKLGLNLCNSPAKTRIFSPMKDMFYLGARITPKGRIRPTERAWMKLEKRMDVCVSLLGVERDGSVIEQMFGSCRSWLTARKHYHFRASDLARIERILVSSLAQSAVKQQRRERLVRSTMADVRVCFCRLAAERKS